MKRLSLAVAAALVSTAFSAAALAQTTAPSAAPNAGKTGNPPRAFSGKGAAGSQARQHLAQRQAAVGEVRDWNAIDTNHDHLIEPEEMEAYLNQGKGAGKTQ